MRITPSSDSSPCSSLLSQPVLQTHSGQRRLRSLEPLPTPPPGQVPLLPLTLDPRLHTAIPHTPSLWIPQVSTPSPPPQREGHLTLLSPGASIPSPSLALYYDSSSYCHCLHMQSLVSLLVYQLFPAQRHTIYTHDTQEVRLVDDSAQANTQPHFKNTPVPPLPA